MLLRTKNGICVDDEVFVNCKFGYDINCEDGSIKMPQPLYPSCRKGAKVATTIDTECFVRFHDALVKAQETGEVFITIKERPDYYK